MLCARQVLVSPWLEGRGITVSEQEKGSSGSSGCEVQQLLQDGKGSAPSLTCGEDWQEVFSKDWSLLSQTTAEGLSVSREPSLYS